MTANETMDLQYFGYLSGPSRNLGERERVMDGREKGEGRRKERRMGTAEQRRPPGVGDLGVPLARSVACFALLFSEDTALPFLATCGTSGAAPILGEGSQAADPEAFLRRRPGGRGWPGP